MNTRTRSRFVAIAAMIARMREALEAIVGPISEPVHLAGGASKDACAVDAGGEKRLVEELDDAAEPHPAIEVGLWWLRENRPPAREPVVVHGDFRIGNVAVDAGGLVGVLDWEFAHLDEPARDLAFGLVRAWRFGRDDLRLGGIGDAEPYLERYNELTGFDVRPEELDYWEVAGNVGWAIGCLTQTQRHLTRQDRSVELAVLGRLGAEVEYEICHLLARQGVT